MCTQTSDPKRKLVVGRNQSIRVTTPFEFLKKFTNPEAMVFQGAKLPTRKISFVILACTVLIEQQSMAD